jgi:hypothetical protein
MKKIMAKISEIETERTIQKIYEKNLILSKNKQD